MKWFRANIRHGAKLALFALAVQLILSFGHVHGGTVHAAPLDATIALSAGDVAKTPAAPDNDHHHHRAADPCAICAVMAMAGTAVFAVPPVLLLPQAAVLLQQITEAEFDHLDAITGASQPRGPPLS